MEKLELFNFDTMLVTPSALMKLKVTPEQKAKFNRIILAGESAPLKLIKELEGIKLYNGYGPSEITVISSFGPINPDTPQNIGTPLVNSIQYIVDKDMKLVPIGVPGELLIGGSGVALGYLNRPDLTAEKFIPNCFLNDGSQLYRSGDLCKWTSEGELEIIGRMDDMVKVKGFRIELDEVAFAVGSHAQVAAAAVIVKNDRLVAFVTPADVDVDSVRDHVLQVLPPFMAPTSYVCLKDFPKNQNGKIDKNVLKAMEITVEVEVPVTEREKTLAKIWSDLLK
ncbi:hypothetical protein HDV01_003047, partial [Terramyces sp. JEL0728]